MQKPIVPFTDLLKLDIRVGHILDASKVEKSNKLLQLTVDLGSEYGTVTIFTGMQKWYTPEDFKDKKFLFVANLEPKKIMETVSQGMILSADIDGKPFLIPVDQSLAAGTPIL